MTTFINFARAHGVDIDPGKLYASEKVKRCPTEAHPRSKNGAYFWDGQRSWVFAWDGEARVQWFNDPNAKPWTEAGKAAWRAKRDAARKAEEQKRGRAAVLAAETLRETKPARHNYLYLKGFTQMEGLVAPDGALVVPMRDWKTNEVRGGSVQWAQDRYKKQHCASAEGKYVPPPAVDRDRDSASMVPFMPDLNAMHVQQSLLVVPKQFRMVLFAIYVPQRQHPMVARRHMRITASQWEGYLTEGLRRFWAVYFSRHLRHLTKPAISSYSFFGVQLDVTACPMATGPAFVPISRSSRG